MSTFSIRLRCFDEIVAEPFNLRNFDNVRNALTELSQL